MFKKKSSSSSDVLRKFIFGDAGDQEFLAHVNSESPYPWNKFVEAQASFDAGRIDQAINQWREIATSRDVDTRATLQAWTFLRKVGINADSDRAKEVLGVVAEVPTSGGHDLLAAYENGGVRYLNFAGGSVVVEDQSLAEIQIAVNQWLTVGSALVKTIGPWSEPRLPDLPNSQGRITMLTPSGPHFGQGALQQLESDPGAAAFLRAATTLLLLVVKLPRTDNRGPV